MNYKQSLNIKLLVGLMLILLLNASCRMVKSSVRDYSQKDFNSVDWKSGDAIERGRRLGDIFKNRSRYINGKTEKELVEMLGEPDEKKEKNGKLIWLYNLEFQRDSKPKMAITIISGVGMYGFDGQRGQMTALEQEDKR